MEECVQRMELQGKELNPTTCTFVKKCPEGEVRNEKGRCVKSKKNAPVVNVRPFTYTEAPKKPKREIPGEGKVKFTRKRPMVARLNNEEEKRGPPNPRLRRTAKLYKNPPPNSNYRTAWKNGFKEVRNSLSIEANKRGEVVIPKVRKTRAKKNYAISLSPNEGAKPLRQNAENNLGLVFDVEHNGQPKLLRKVSANKTPSTVMNPENNQLMGMYEAQQPPVNSRRLQRRKARNQARKESAVAVSASAPLGTGF
jgi:hypothetical protein